jgi:hypothetical protein
MFVLVRIERAADNDDDDDDDVYLPVCVIEKSCGLQNLSPNGPPRRHKYKMKQIYKWRVRIT